MKGLMGTLLITLGAGIAHAQQYNESRFSDGTLRSGATASDSGSQSSNRRSNSTRLSPLNPSARVNGPRVAQSSSRGDGFEVTSSQTFGGSRPTGTDGRTIADMDDRSRADLGGGQTTSFPSSNTRPLTNDPRVVDGQRNSYPAGQDTRLNSQQAPPPFTLQVTDNIAKKLKENGYLRANVKDNIQGSVDRIVMFADQGNMNQVAVSGNVTDNDVSMVNDYVVIDVDDYTLRKIEKGTMNLKDLAGNRFQGVVLRYTGSDGRNIPIQSIPELSPRVPTSTSVADRDPFVANGNSYDQNNLDRNNVDRSPIDRRDSRLDLTADRRPIASDNRGGSWQVNDDLRTPRRRDFNNNENYDRTRNQDVDRTRNQDSDRFASRNTQFDNGDRTLGDRYLDGMPVTNRIDSDTRDRDYVLGAIDRSRERTDTDYSRGRVDQGNSRYGDYDNSRSPSYQETLDEQARVYRARLAAQERERELDREARWVEEQKRSLAQRTRTASTYPLTPPAYPGRQRYPDDRYPDDRFPSERYPEDPNRQQRERLADRSTDPTYGGRPAAVPSYRSEQTTSIEGEVANMLKDREDRFNAKIAAVDHILKLNAAEQKLDSKIEKIQDERGSRVAGSNSIVGRVSSYNDQGPVKGTLGGNMASRGLQSSDRYASNVGYKPNVPDGRPGGSGIALDVNSGRYGTNKNYATEPTDGRMLRFMWLMLLLSLGANFYLAMLSRSFYTRYDELADELRETFSTTNNF